MTEERESKHTPGEWKIDIQCHSYRDEYGRDAEPPETCYKVLSSMSLPTSVVEFWDMEWGSEAEANARLIAAAPDLLAALEGVTIRTAPDGELCYCEPRIIADRAAHSVDCTNARAAIAKAKP